MEQLLHYVWKHKIFPLHELQTTTGLPVEVIDTGLPNSDSGPILLLLIGFVTDMTVT